MILCSKCVTSLSGSPWESSFCCAWPCSSHPLCLGGSGMVQPRLLLGMPMDAWPRPWDAGLVQGRSRSVQGEHCCPAGCQGCPWQCWGGLVFLGMLVLWQLMLLSPLFPFSRVDLANATNPAPCSKSLRLPKPPMALLHTGQTKPETGEGGENERRGGRKKKEKTKEKRKKKIKAEAHSWNYYEK